VADLRAFIDRFPAQKDVLRGFLAPLEAHCAAQGWKVGATTPEAQEAVLVALAGGWIEETDRATVMRFIHCTAEERAKLPPLPEVVLGGFMVPEFYQRPQPEVPAPEPGKSRLFQILSGAPMPKTPWDLYLEQQEPEHRARLAIVRRILERHRELLGERAPSGWEQRHHFAFIEHPPLSLSARAWGDLQVAIAGKGHYLDYYT
jgi:hypothetical protein